MEQTKKVVKWILQNEDERAVDRIAIVEDPAIGEGMLVFANEASKQEDNLAEKFFFEAYEFEKQSKRRFQVDESKFEHLKGQNLVFAPLMIADKLIIRQDQETGELFYGYFPYESIVEAQRYFVENKLLDSFDIEHDQDKKITSIQLLENWIVEDPEQDKSAFFGYRLERGSWVGILKIEDNELYEAYKNLPGAGFSVEAWVQEQILFKSDNGTEVTGAKSVSTAETAENKLNSQKQ